MEKVIPAFPSMAINVSTLNRTIFPRVRSLILGCVTPRSCAASDWVSPSAPRRSRSSIINCDRSRKFSASAGPNPRSTKTFPLPRMTRGSGSRTTRDDFAVALPSNADVEPRRAARPLLERVEDIDRFLEFRDIEHPKGAASPDPELLNSRANHQHWLGVRGVESALQQVELMTSTSTNSYGKSLEIFPGCTHPEHRLPSHEIYTYLYAWSSQVQAAPLRARSGSSVTAPSSFSFKSPPEATGHVATCLRAHAAN